jgi:2'-5' RNA ligase
VSPRTERGAGRAAAGEAVAARPRRERLFVALDPPAAVRAELAAWRDRCIAGRDDVRPVAEVALHVTLVFLGYQPEKEIPRIAALLEDARLEAPVLEAREVKTLPPRRPRLFALDLDDEGGRASALQADLSASFEAARLYKPEKRPFWPHVTLARVKRNARASGWKGPPPPRSEWRAEALTLYRSVLRPQGALYEPLAVVPLPPA